MKIKLIKIGVIIPCFNAETTIESCIDSVLRQTYRNFELIVVDDASTDNTYQIVDRLTKIDSRIKLFRNSTNRGQGFSRNYAAELIDADYVTYLDADDYFYKDNFFETCVRKLETGVDLLITPAIREYERNKFFYDKFECQDGLYRNETIVNLYLSRKLGTHAAWGKFYNSSLLKSAKFIECGFSQDVLFVVNAILSSSKVLLVSDHGYVYSQLVPSTWRINKVKLDHVLSGLRLLAEVISKQKESRFIVLSRFFKLWNKDHGQRINQYITEGQISNSDICVLQQFLKCLGKLFLPLLSNIQSSKIREFLIDIYFQHITQDIPASDYSRYLSYAKDINCHFCLENKTKVENKLVISLTSYPPRIDASCKAIESILNQELPSGSLVVLYLSETDFPDKNQLPKFIINQFKKGNLLIKWEKENLKSFKKLIPAIRDFPNNPILTIDDDVIYPPGFVLELYKEFLINPDQIHCNRCRRIIFKQKGVFSPYISWPIENQKEPLIASYDLLFTGVGGVLYPPNSLNGLVSNSSLFMQLCPNGDDFWFWLMALLNGTKIHRIDHFFKINFSSYVPNSQEEALWKTNVVDGNDEILRNIVREFPFVIDILTTQGKKYSGKSNFVLKLRKKIYRDLPILYKTLSKTKRFITSIYH